MSLTSFEVRDIRTHKTLYQENSNHKIYLFSITKMFLSYVLMNYLDLDETFQTKIFYDGIIQDKVLKGNLYIEGGGDPYLSPNTLLGLSFKIKNSLKKIQGQLFIKHSHFPKMEMISKEFPAEDAYNTSLSPLNFNWNRLPKNSIISFSKIETTEKHVKDMPVNNSEDVSKNYLEFLLNNILEKKNLKKQELHMLFIEKSPPLLAMIKNLMEYSNNLISEALGYKLIHKQFPEERDKKSLDKKLKQLMEKEVSGLTFDKASGLSSQNIMSTKHLLDFLQKNYNSLIKGESFLSIFPAKSYANLKKPFQIYTKTGTAHFAISIAGYLITEKKNEIIFSYSNYDPKKRFLLSKNPNNQKLIKEAELFYKEAKKKEEDFILKIFHQY
jgi:D-alanyl-D-alanine carboxypeptidase